jgi:tetratricopeptide (TPR) repeat protein
MSQSKFISRFSPNRTAPEDLERIFVQRHELLTEAVALLRESALTGNKHHLLFIGPRGCGKTHLLALIAYRLESQADLADGLRIAWLNEDETSTSFLDLLVRIYRALAGRYPEEFPDGELKALYGGEPEEAQARLAEALVRRAGKRTVLVLAENLDGLFKELEESGQRAWRALIQNHPVFATAASAQSLFAGVSDRQQPFFGFFDTRRLSPLAVDEATELLRKIARLNGSGELEAFLDTPRGHSRVRAIHHLSGGNHRLYIVLSDFITRETLEELARPFERMVDEQLTPYYQERLRWLSPQQRKIVEFLCLRSRPVPVKEIAERLFATHSTIASQLKQLREMGYVISYQRGRESLYELAEPLMRLSMQIKETHAGQPLGLLVDFLRVWYEREELEQRLARFDAAAPEREYFVAALEKFQSGEPNLRHQFLRQEVEGIDIEHCDQAHLGVLKVLAEESGGPGDWFKYAAACFCRGQHAEALDACNRTIDLPGAPREDVGRAMLLRGLTFGQTGRIEEEVADYTRVVELPGASVEQVARALSNRGISYGQRGRTEEAIADFMRVIELCGAPVEQVAKALYNCGFACGQTGRTDDAIAHYTRVIELPGVRVGWVATALNNRGITYGQTGRNKEAIADFTRVIELSGAPVEQVAMALYNRGVAHGQTGRTEEAIAYYTRVIELPGASAEWVARAFFNRGVAHRQAGRTEEAIADYTRVIELPGAPAEDVATALCSRGLAYGRAGRTEEELVDYSHVIELPGAPVEGVARALNNRGVAYSQAGRTEEALGDYTGVLELPGAPVEEAARALNNRGVAYGQTGRTEDEIADYTRIIELPGASVEWAARATVNLAETLLNADRWDAGVGQLPAILAEPAAPPGATAFVSDAVLAAVFRQMGTPEVWQARLIQAVGLYAQHGSLTHLGDALVRHLAKLAGSVLNNSGLDQWLACWESAASEHEAMRLPLRLLRAGIDYIKTQPRDEGVLLQLPKEERALVRQALGLAPETSD